jgi:hypothetical protein
MPLVVVYFTPDTAVSVIPIMPVSISTLRGWGTTSASRVRSLWLAATQDATSRLRFRAICHKSATNLSTSLERFEKASQFWSLTRGVVPRPGIEPGLEVPETSVMSFSLPGRRQTDAINIPASTEGQGEPARPKLNYHWRESACAASSRSISAWRRSASGRTVRIVSIIC